MAKTEPPAGGTHTILLDSSKGFWVEGHWCKGIQLGLGRLLCKGIWAQLCWMRKPNGTLTHLEWTLVVLKQLIAQLPKDVATWGLVPPHICGLSCINLIQQQFKMNPGLVVHLLIASVQTKDSLHYPLLITPICDASFQDLQGTDTHHLRQNT